MPWRMQKGAIMAIGPINTPPVSQPPGPSTAPASLTKGASADDVGRVYGVTTFEFG